MYTISLSPVVRLRKSRNPGKGHQTRRKAEKRMDSLRGCLYNEKRLAPSCRLVDGQAQDSAPSLTRGLWANSGNMAGESTREAIIDRQFCEQVNNKTADERISKARMPCRRNVARGKGQRRDEQARG